MKEFLDTIQNLLNKAGSDEGLEVTIGLDTEVYIKLFITITLSIAIATSLSVIVKNFFKAK